VLSTTFYPRLPRRLLTISLLLAFSLPAYATSPVCPVGLYTCPKKNDDWSLCKKNALFDFYINELPVSGDREQAATDFNAERISSGDPSHYVMEGNAEIQRLDQLIRADRITYDNETTAYSASGNLRYQDRDLLMSASDAEGNSTSRQSTLHHVRYQLLSSRGNGTADSIIVNDAQHAELNLPTYTTCDVDAAAWTIRAHDITINQDEGVGRGHDVTFLVHDTPIFWLPYLRFPTDDRRASGFLYPNIGYTERRGFDFTLPYYLNLAPNYDATLYPRLMTERGLMLGADFRYLTERSHGELEWTYLANDRVADRDRGSFHFQNDTYLNNQWNASVNINQVSDDRYFEDFGRGLNLAATSLLPSTAYLNGRGSWWNASIGADQYQITDPTLNDNFEPYHRLPRFTFNGAHELLGNLVGGVKSEFVAFSKENSLEGQRFDVYPYLAYPIENAAYFFRPELGYRYTSYNLDRDQNTTPTRALPIASIDTGLVFERNLMFGDEAYINTLEPRLYYLRVPNRDQTTLPVFDTQTIPFSFAELFRSNHFVGADRQMDANNLTLAMTTRLLENASGEERVSASLGQIRYFDDQQVQLPGVPATDYAGSNYAGEVNLHLNERWRLTLSDQWNPNTDQTDLSAISVQNRFGDTGVFNFSYRFRRNFLEQTDVSSLIPLSPQWSLIGRWNYSLRDRETLESFVGIEHDSCCVAWRALVRHWVHNAEGQSDNALYFELEFKGIGSIGQKTDNFLQHAILGYQ